MSTSHSADHAEAYASRPWLQHYPAGVKQELGDLPHDNLPDLLRGAAAAGGDEPAFTVCLPNGLAGSLSFMEVEQWADALAVYLRQELNLQKGDRVALQLPNCLAYPVAMFGVANAGCVLVNVNPMYTPRELLHQLRDSGAKALIVLDMFADKLLQVLPQTDVKHVLVASVADFLPKPVQLAVKGTLRWQKMIPKQRVKGISFTKALTRGEKLMEGLSRLMMDPVLGDDLFALQYTGGTTGLSKGAMLTQSNITSNIYQVLNVLQGVSRADLRTALTALPLYHIFAFTVTLVSFCLGARNVLIPNPRPVSNMRKAFERYDIDFMSGVNTLYAGLLAEEWFRRNPPADLQHVVAGGSALQKQVARKWLKNVGGEIYQGYGLTETSPVAAINPFAGQNKIKTVGIPVASTDMKVVAKSGKEAAQGEPGELWVKGPQVMAGYWNKPEDTAAVLTDGWFHTGDIGLMDDQGYFKLVDRKNDLINVSGFNVYPNEVEECIAEHPGVVEVGVVGVSDDESGEQVVAYVVRRDEGLTEAQLQDFCRKRLTAYKVPRKVVFRATLPKTAVGKILRKDLRSD